MKKKLFVDENGILRVANSTEVERETKVSTLIKKANSLLNDLHENRKELKTKVLAMVGIRKKFSEDKDVTEKEVKKTEKSVDSQVNVVEEIIDNLKEMLKKLLDIKNEDVVSDDEKKEIKKLLEETEDSDLDTEEELDEAEEELLKDTKKEPKEKEEPKEKFDEEEKAASLKIADLVKTKEDAKKIVDTSNTITEDKEGTKAKIDLSTSDDEVKKVLESSGATKTSSKKRVSNILKRLRMKRLASKGLPREELSPRFLYTDRTLRKNYIGKDSETEAAQKEYTENESYRKELKKMDRAWLTKSYNSVGKVHASIQLEKRRASLRMERAFDLATEKQFKGLIDNPLKQALISNLGDEVIPLIEKSYLEASEKTFDTVKEEASKLASLKAKDFVKEAKLVREENPITIDSQEGVSVPIKTSSVSEENLYKSFFESKKDRVLGGII